MPLTARQPELPFGDRPSKARYWQARGEEFRALLVEVMDLVPLKQLADELGVDESTISHAKSASKTGQHRHVIKAEWVPILVAHAAQLEPLRFLAALVGKDVTDSAEPTPEEWVSAAKGTLADLFPPDMRRLIFDQIRARAANTRR